MSSASERQTALKVLEIEAQAILDLRTRLDSPFDRALDTLAGAHGRVVLTGIGKSGIIAQKISATLASTGTPSLFLHPTEALHGDLGRVVEGDVVLAVSYSGETREILALLPAVKRLGCPVVAVTGDPSSSLARVADCHLDASIQQEACPLGLAPTASTTAALALGDALAMALLERKGFTVENFASMHPGGRLGRRLCQVRELMHSGDQVPTVAADTSMKDVLFEMTRKRLGMTTVMDAEGRLLGIISDGDLRRQLERYGYTLFEHSAAECMTLSPVLIRADEFAAEALALMEARRITSLVVTDADRHVEGVVHLHDLWDTQGP